ncbi:TlpA disulfide reductase family protein [Yeosuana marina]|uniref:TlpA family protein disulfide reductase n=1 Tax=Yeosuana marina TaxID=1565536 RepID=UPI0030C7A1B6
MKLSKSQRSNLFFLLIIAILIIPQTRKPIQIFLNKGLALISPSVESKEKQTALKSYDWKLKNENGKVFNFESTKGKVVFVNFWATWCPPCIAEMPSIQKLYTDYQDKVIFLFVTSDFYSDINPFLDKNKYSFKVYRPLDGSTGLFDVPSIPRTFLIDQNGNIVIDESGAANWNSDKVRATIDGLLKQ